MPTARLSARPALRRAAFAAAFVAAALAFASSVNTSTTSACLTVAPTPLRALYATSDLVVVGSLGDTTAVEMLGVNEQGTYENYLMRTDLKVSSTVKGDGNYSTVHVYHGGWKYNGAADHFLSRHKGADNLLVFLRRRQGGDGYEPVDRAYGIKRLTNAALKVYVQRLYELDSILREQEEPDPARIVEWLVRCAEEPETRWEGLYELARSNEALLAEKRMEEEKKNKEAAALEAAAAKDEADQPGDAPGVTAPAAGEEKRGVPVDTLAAAADAVQTDTIPLPTRRILFSYEPKFIKLLTPEQKSRLANILFSTKTITHTEMPLVEMVRQWGDPRLVPFVMSQLRAFKDAPPFEAESLVTGLAEILDDEELIKLAERYCEDASYEDPDPASAADEEEGEEAEGEAAGAEDGEEEDADEQPVYGNSAQRRTIRLERFIARAENVMTR